ncbi:MAG TPA: HAD family phosphatase [Clostridiales bacterium]|nr:HAD family phosphatase [Clostridiales bacterium]
MYIFDLDGTLIDSNGLWVDVDVEFLTRRGLTITAEYEAVVARSIFPAAAQFTRSYYHLPDTPEEIMAEWEELAAHHYRDLVPLKPGAEAFLRQCQREGRPLSLFTACRPRLCQLALDRFGFTPLFRHIVYAEALGLDKHDPRCFARLCQLMEVSPQQCTLFDDNPDNCATAVASGMAAVGVYDPLYAHRKAELSACCTRFVHSLEELLCIPAHR